MKHYTLLLTCLALSFSGASAFAQNPEYKGGLNYTTLGAKASKSESAANKAATETPAEDKTETPEEDPATRVWNKYKDLATGTAAEKEAKEKAKTADAPEKPEAPSVDKPEKPSIQAKQEEEVSSSGIAALLQEWKENKKNQREMRSMSFRTPKTDKAE